MGHVPMKMTMSLGKGTQNHLSLAGRASVLGVMCFEWLLCMKKTYLLAVFASGVLTYPLT